jgi:hypothetical protein
VRLLRVPIWIYLLTWIVWVDDSERQGNYSETRNLVDQEEEQKMQFLTELDKTVSEIQAHPSFLCKSMMLMVYTERLNFSLIKKVSNFYFLGEKGEIIASLIDNWCIHWNFLFFWLI